MSTWATAAPPPKRIARRPRTNASKTPRDRTRKDRKRSILPFLPFEVLDLIGRYLFDAPSSVPGAPFPSSYHVRDRFPDDRVSSKADRYHGRELAKPTGLREIMALARTCRSLNHFFGPWTSDFGGMGSEEHLPALKQRIGDVKYLYLNTMGNKMGEVLSMLGRTGDRPLQIKEIVIKKCAHSSKPRHMEWTPSPSGDSRLPEHSLPYFQSFTLGKEVCALCGSLILSSFLNKDMCNLKHLRISLPLSKLDVSWSGFRMRRGKVLRFTRPQVESLESMLGCISPLMGERVQTLHLETRCERKRWGGLCETGLSSNDPQPRERKSTQTKGSNACSPELSDDSTDDESDTDTDADGRSDESGEDDDDGDTPESATVSGASASGINSSTSTSTTPALDGVGSGQNQGSRLSKTEQRLATLGQNQRHTMLSEHQQFNQMISATFPSLEELRVYRAGVTRLEIMKETSDLDLYIEAFVNPFEGSRIKSMDFSMVISTQQANRLGRLRSTLSADAFAERAKEAKADLEAWRDTVMRCFIMGEAPAADKPVNTVDEITPVANVEPKIEAATPDKAVKEQSQPRAVVRPKPVPVVKPVSLPSLTREQLEAATRAILNGIPALPPKPPIIARTPGPRRPEPAPVSPPLQVTELKPTAVKTLDSWPGTVVHGRFYLPNMDAKVRPKACLHVFEWTAPTLANERTNNDDHESLNIEAQRLREESARAAASTVTIKPVKLVRFA